MREGAEAGAESGAEAGAEAAAPASCLKLARNLALSSCFRLATNLDIKFIGSFARRPFMISSNMLRS